MTPMELMKKAMPENDEEEDEETEEENYVMSKSEAISEHENLVKILRSGDKTAQLFEAKKQEKELKKIKK